MHLAADRGHQGIVDILLQHGADVNSKNAGGKLIICIHTCTTQFTFIKGGKRIKTEKTLESKKLSLIDTIQERKQ